MSEITEFTDTAAPAPAPMPSFWEDVIEIFIHPVDVLRRRKDAGMWAPLLFVALTIGIISFATFNTLQPVFEAEFTRNTAKAIAQNPAAAEQMNKFKDMSLAIGRYTLAIIMVISILVTGLVSWIVSRVVGAKSTLGQMMTIAAWAYFPRIFSSIAGAIEGLVMDPQKMTSALAISLSPARFLDPETTNPMVYQLLGRLDITIIWETVLLAIGVYVAGKVSKNSAIVFGVLMWVLGLLPALRQAYMLM